MGWLASLLSPAVAVAPPVPPPSPLAGKGTPVTCYYKDGTATFYGAGITAALTIDSANLKKMYFGKEGRGWLRVDGK